MKILLTVAVFTLMAGSAYAQGQTQMPRAGEATGKSEKEIKDEIEADKAYRKSLGNIPAQKAPDPWGTVRGDNAPKAAVKNTAAKRAKAGGVQN